MTNYRKKALAPQIALIALFCVFALGASASEVTGTLSSSGVTSTSSGQTDSGSISGTVTGGGSNSGGTSSGGGGGSVSGGSSGGGGGGSAPLTQSSGSGSVTSGGISSGSSSSAPSGQVLGASTFVPHGSGASAQGPSGDLAVVTGDTGTATDTGIAPATPETNLGSSQTAAVADSGASMFGSLCFWIILVLILLLGIMTYLYLDARSKMDNRR